MTKEGVTKSDLLEMENRINKEQQDARHNQNNIIQKTSLKTDETASEVKVLSNNVMNMSELIKRVEKVVEDGFKDMKEELKNGYTPISEHRHNEKRIEKIEKVMYWIAGIIGTAVLGAILTLILK